MSPTAVIPQLDVFTPHSGPLDAIDLIEALCACGEWEIARRVARQHDQRRCARIARHADAARLLASAR